MNKATSVEEYKLISSFQTLRRNLLEEKYQDRLDKPLAYWALPNDRRLPLAFLGRTLKTLLATPYDELAATPGIGHKKIGSLIKLLGRAIKDHPPSPPFGVQELVEPHATNGEKARDGVFDPAVVSESLWQQWRETVKVHNVGCEKLGRLAPTLQALPTVIWHTPLSTYLDYSLAQIRQLRTHGEKRVRVILEIFWTVHEMLARCQAQRHLAVRLAPRFVQPLECWVADVLGRDTTPSKEEIREFLVAPLLEQTETDIGSTVARLAEGRLGVEASPQSVRHQSKRMGVTRARIYQLLEDCGKIMEVRWPEGRTLLRSLAEKFAHEGEFSNDLDLFHAAVELFYPEKTELAEAAVAEAC